MLLDAAPADGTTPGVQGVTITNGGTTTYNWQLGREPSRVTVVPDAGSLAPGASVSITVYFWDQGIAPSATAGTYSTVSHVYDTAGVYPPVSLPVSVAETNVSQQWYVAEGYTGGSFTEHLTLAHPGSANTNVTVEYLLANGTPITRAYGVAGRSRATINVNKAIGAGQNVSVVVTSDQPIVAERPMYFSYGGGQAGGTDIVGYQPSAPLASPAVAWNVQASASPSPVSPYASQYANYLYGVAGASSNDMRAVGQYLTSNNWASLIEHGDGTLWSVVPSPSVYGGGLQGVAVVSATDIWAVGAFGSNYSALIEHWDGTSCTIVPDPEYTTDELAGLAFVSAHDIWGVRFTHPIPYPDFDAFTEHYGS